MGENRDLETQPNSLFFEGIKPATYDGDMRFCIITSLCCCICGLSCRDMFAQHHLWVPASKITHPDVQRGDRFGDRVAVVGETIAITARDDDVMGTDSGAVYLFDRGGEHLRTLRSPNASENGFFGDYLAPVGDDRLLISASFENDSAGRAYLFDVSGKLLHTFEAPSPSAGANFGGRALLSDNDHIYIASYFEFDESSRRRQGAVYKYDMNGELVTKLVSPRQTDSCFGRSATFVGNDKILVGDACDDSSGVRAGAAFLFDLDGQLLQTFDNPDPMDLDNLGSSVAAAGDRLLIGGPQIDDESNGDSTGAAYIFGLDGTLVTRVSDPEPNPGNWFGWNAGTTEDGLFIVGSVFNSSGVGDAGKLFLVDNSGLLVQTISSPERGRGQQFGVSFVQSEDMLLIGEVYHGDDRTGAVWVFNPAEPGDYNANGEFDVDDLDRLCQAVGFGVNLTELDVTGDAVLNHDDVTRFLDLASTAPGDANVDGNVAFDDFLSLTDNFGDDFRVWSEGDFDCNLRIDFRDFILLSQNYGSIRETPLAAVPEPTSAMLFGLALLGLGAFPRSAMRVR